MITVKVFEDGKMINQTSGDYVVVFTGTDEKGSNMICGKFSMADLGATLCSGTVECVAAVCREIGVTSSAHLAIINAISAAVKKQGHESILAEIAGGKR